LLPGFGPIVRDQEQSRGLYAGMFKIPFKEDEAAIFTRTLSQE
jgi:hypothetical protein